MDLDRLIHEKKHFAELQDADVEEFLRDRRFGSEHLSLEFKGSFPQKTSGRYQIREICKYIVGLSNEEGGIVVYGVSDAIKDPTVPFPDYVAGLACHPSLEDLSQWVKERVHPLIASPAIRLFQAEKKKIAIFKIPPGVNKPYCYYDPETRSVTYFKKTAGGIAELAPNEIREFHRTQTIEQARLTLQVLEHERPGLGVNHAQDTSAKRSKHILTMLEDPHQFGLFHVLCRPLEEVQIAVSALELFLQEHRSHFSESMRYFSKVDAFQDGVSVGYFPHAVRQDVRSTIRISLYRDGTAALDSLVDQFMDGDKQLHASQLCYEIQRHLQLSKAVLKASAVTRISVSINFSHLEGFKLVIPEAYWARYASYTGIHDPIVREVKVAEIHDYSGNKRNVVMSVVVDIMNEVGRIFGLSQAPANLWDADGRLNYVKGLEHQR